MLKLCGFALSNYHNKVKLALLEKQVPFELVPVDFAAGEHKSAAHLARQPFGQVPYIDDDGFVLYESRAICRYIAAKYRNQGATLLPDPTDLKALALFEQAASIEVSNFDGPASRIAIQRIFRP